MDASVGDGVAGVLEVEFDAGDSLLTAAGALLDHDGGVRVSRAREGVLRSVANAARQREQTPVRVSAERETTARFAPDHHGELAACDLGDRTVRAARSTFLAATGDVRVGAGRVGNAPDRGVGLFLTTLSGDGTAFLAGRGRVERVDVDGEYAVAADHVVAFDGDADVTVERAGALEDATPVCRVAGGAVWVGTRRAER
ncbi:AIM24 family protein [Halobacterium litoreum]|uniref:AIM24 family protein n=1 Tax=Halobacterium litoreum TaxID=2039234 RepID=A0ABD5NFZ0_9EURY|nr:AIM24 family protein [Halobacterium litoreum]UHH13007.1 AIM24 family protein [Halobacterium litoreum]